MQCPACTTTLVPTDLAGTTIETCPDCKGMWFDQGELRAAKDTRLHEYHWFDLDLWKHDADFLGEPSGMHCPLCGPSHPLTSIRYNTSATRIDVCVTCHGIWLDANELEAIMVHIRENAEATVLHHYTGALLGELDKALTGTGPERTTLVDILTLIDLFKYKFTVEHERLAQLLANLPR